jgi:hypothetical protein
MPAFVGAATVGVLVPLAICTIHAFAVRDRESAMGGAMLTLVWVVVTLGALAAWGGV